MGNKTEQVVYQGIGLKKAIETRGIWISPPQRMMTQPFLFCEGGGGGVTKSSSYGIWEAALGDLDQGVGF